MGRNEETTSIKGQEDQATLFVSAFKKEKLVAMQQQLLEQMTQHRSSQQCLPQGQTNIPKGPVKRQVTEDWNKMKSNEGVGSKTLGKTLSMSMLHALWFSLSSKQAKSRKGRGELEL